MINKEDYDAFSLTCDHCEEEAEETFETFEEAVQFKKDNGWRSVKNVFENTWSDLCPDCQSPSILAEHKGIA